MVVEPNGAIPKKVKFDEVPASQPQALKWRDSKTFDIDTPESDDEWNISRPLSNLHLTPSTIATMPNQQTAAETTTAPVKTTAIRPAQRPLPIQSIVHGSHPQGNATYTVSSNTPIASCRTNEPYLPSTQNRQLQPQPFMRYQDARHQPWPYPIMNPVWVPNYGQLHPNMMPRPYPYCQYMTPPMVQPMQMQNASQVTQPIQRCFPQAIEPNRNEESNTGGRERRRGSVESNPSSPSSSSSGSSDSERRNENNRDGRRRRRSTSPSDQYDRDECGERTQNRAPQNGNNGNNNLQRAKTVPVNQWRIGFSGDTNSLNKHDVNIHKFLEQVKLFRKASRITENELLEQIIHLLSGNARDWYQNAHRRIRTWPQFTNELRRKFLPADYNYDLVAQANRRKQGKNESVSSYINAMEMLFQAMPIPMADHHRLYIVRSNLLPHSADIVAATNPQTIAEVEAVCKRLESSRKQQRENLQPPTTTRAFRPRYGNANGVEEIDGNLSENGNASGDDSDNGDNNECAAVRQFENKQKKIVKSSKANEKSAPGNAKENTQNVNNVELCFNCKAAGHQQRECKRKWKKHCCACGYEDVVARECPKCNPEMAKNGQVNQEGRAGRFTAGVCSPIENCNSNTVIKDAVNAVENMIEVALLITAPENERRPHLEVTINGRQILGLLDSGANITMLGKDTEHIINTIDTQRQYPQHTIRTADGGMHTTQSVTDIPYTVNGKTKFVKTLIIPSITTKLILGTDFWKAFDIKPMFCCFAESSDDAPQHVDPVNVKHDLTAEQNDQLNEIISLFETAPKDGILGCTDRAIHTINTGNATPIRQRHYVVSPYVQKGIDEEIDRMLRKDIIEPIENPTWINPIVAVKKSNDKYRICIDARKLNSVTVKNAYPQTNPNRILGLLRGTKYLSAIDLSDAFYQIGLDSESRKKTRCIHVQTNANGFM